MLPCTCISYSMVGSGASQESPSSTAADTQTPGFSLRGRLRPYAFFGPSASRPRASSRDKLCKYLASPWPGSAPSIERRGRVDVRLLMVAEEILAESVGSPAEVGGDTSLVRYVRPSGVPANHSIALQRFCAAARAPAPFLSIPTPPGVPNARDDGPERGRIDDVDRSREQGRLTVQ